MPQVEMNFPLEVESKNSQTYCMVEASVFRYVSIEELVGFIELIESSLEKGGVK